MIVVGIGSIPVFTEALPFRIVVVVDAFAAPITMTLDSEVIVALSRERTVSVPAFQQTLSQRDACWNPVQLHLLDRCIPPLGYIFLRGKPRFTDTIRHSPSEQHAEKNRNERSVLHC